MELPPPVVAADTTNGRIYRVIHGDRKGWTGNLSKLTDAEFRERFYVNPEAATFEAGMPLSSVELEALSDADAFTARILLIHHYRRVVLRDPLLPTALLPADWPGRAARKLCGEIYRGLLPASEQWLDRYASNENGPLPAAGKELSRRFAD